MGSIALKHQVAGSGHDAAIPRTRVLVAPHFLLMNGVPREEKSLLTLQRILERLPFAGGYFGEVDRHVVTDCGAPEILVGLKREAFFLRRNIGQPGLRIECHRLPVMPTARSRPRDKRLPGLIVARLD